MCELGLSKKVLGKVPPIKIGDGHCSDGHST